MHPKKALVLVNPTIVFLKWTDFNCNLSMTIQRRWRLFTELTVLTALSNIVRALEPAKPPSLSLRPAPFFSLKQVVKQNMDKNKSMFIIQIFLNQNLSQNVVVKWNDMQMSKTLQIFRIESWICYDLIRLYHRLLYHRLY